MHIVGTRNRPRGKESTEVRITQNKGKESENFPFPYFELIEVTYMSSYIFKVQHKPSQ